MPLRSYGLGVGCLSTIVFPIDAAHLQQIDHQIRLVEISDNPRPRTWFFVLRLIGFVMIPDRGDRKEQLD